MIPSKRYRDPVIVDLKKVEGRKKDFFSKTKKIEGRITCSVR